METALARRDFVRLVEYAWKFCRLVMRTALDDATLNSLFRFGANYHRRMNFPDITELSWREGILPDSIWVDLIPGVSCQLVLFSPCV